MCATLVSLPLRWPGVLAIAVAGLVGACASSPTVPSAARPALPATTMVPVAGAAAAATAPAVLRNPLQAPGAPQAIAVVPARYAPETGMAPHTPSTAEGAAKGAAIGSVWGLLYGITSPLVLVPPAAVAMVLLGAGVGAVEGAAAIAPDVRSAGPRVPDPDVAALGLRGQLAAAVAADVARFTPYRGAVVTEVGPQSHADQPDYRALRARGFGAVIEVRIDQVGYGGTGGVDPVVALAIVAQARLVDTATGRPTALRGLIYLSPRHAREDWVRNDAALLRTAVAAAQETLAGRIVDDLVLQAEFETEADAQRLPALCGLAPRDPKPEWRRDPVYERELAPAWVASVTPTLAWEAVPPEAWPYNAIPWSRAGDRRYDLRIWSAADHIPGALVYERIGLTDTSHTVETALQPHSAYFWSVRLRYTLDGEPRATRWSAANRPKFAFPFAVAGAQFQSRLAGGVPQPLGCDAEAMTPCACLDFIPATNYLWLRTP